MTGKTERVVLVKGGANKWYEQAIFIINPDSSEDIPVDFVAEAERIINDFNLTKLAKSAQPAIIPAAKPIPTTEPSMFWGGMLAVASLVIVAILLFGLLS